MSRELDRIMRNSMEQIAQIKKDLRAYSKTIDNQLEKIQKDYQEFTSSNNSLTQHTH